MRFPFLHALLCASAVFLGCSGKVQGQSATNALEFKMRQGQPHPWQSTRYPENQTLSLNAEGDWKVSLSGPLATACDGPCFSVQPKAGSGPADLTVSFRALGSEILPPGKHLGAIEVAGKSLPIRLEVVRRFSYAPFYYRAGFPQGCRKSHPQFPHDDTCDVSNEQPPVNFPALRRAGDSFIDPQFGSPVHRLTDSGFNVSYSSMRAFSATGRYILTSDIEGFLQVWNRETGQKVGEKLSGASIAKTVWDPLVEDRIWFLDGAQVSYRSVLSGKSTVAANFGSRRGERDAFDSLEIGGTADNTDDNWWVFTEPKRKLLCAIDLNGLQPSNQEEHLYCFSYADLGVRSVDFAQVTQVDRVSAKRYVVLLGEPRAHVLSVDRENHRLNHEYVMPPEIRTPHSDVGQDLEGRQLLFWSWTDPFGDKTYVVSGFLNAGENILVPREAGGGLSLIYPIDTNGFRTDSHFGCNWSGYCVLSVYRDPGPGGIPNFAVSEITPGPSCTLRTAVNHGLRDGANVILGGVAPMAELNGIHKIQVVDNKTLVLEDVPCTGVYRKGTGSLAESKAWTVSSPNKDEVVVVRLGGEVRRVAFHRSKLWADQGLLSAYWASPRASISRDGRYVAYSSNLGRLEPNSVLWAEVDLAGELKNAQWRPAQQTADFSWEGPEDVTLLVSEDPDFEQTVYAYRYYSGEGNQHTVDNLAPGTKYYFQLIGDNSSLSGSFETPLNAEAAVLSSVGRFGWKARD